MSLMTMKMWAVRTSRLLTAVSLLAGAAMASTPNVSYESYWHAQENAAATVAGADGAAYTLSTQFDAQGLSTGCRVRQIAADGSTTLLDRSIALAGAQCKALAVAADGSLYVGAEAGAGAETTARALQSSARGRNIVVYKLAADGSTRYATYYGGSGAETLVALGVDAEGQAVIAGQTSSNDLPTEDAWQAAMYSGKSGFVAKLSADGSSLIYASYINFAQVKTLGVAANGVAYAAGAAEAGFDWRNASQQSSGTAAFVAAFAANGKLLYATGVGLGALQPTAVDSLAIDGEALALSGATSVNGASTPYLLRMSADGVVKSSTALPTATLSGSPILASDGAGSLLLAAPGLLQRSVSAVQSSGESFLIALNADGSLNYATPVDGLTTALSVDANGDAHLLGAVGKSSPTLRNAAVQTASSTLNGAVTPAIATQISLLTNAVYSPNSSTTARWEISTTSVTFNGTPKGSLSSPQVITIANDGAVPITLKSFVISNPVFTENNNCGATLDNGKSCTINIFFSPTADGEVSGNLVITPAAASGLDPVTITLKGTAINALFVKSQNADNNLAITMSAGEVGVWYLKLTSAGTLGGQVTFSCYDMPAKATCKVVTPDGTNLSANGNLNFKLFVTTTGSTSGYVNNMGTTETGSTTSSRVMAHAPALFPLFGVMIWGGVVLIDRRRGKKSLRFSLLCGLVGLAMLLSLGGCGKSVEEATVTPAGTYSLVVDTTVQGITQSVTVKMTIQ